MVITRIRTKNSKNLLETMRREILRNLKVKGLEMKKENIRLINENNCLKVSVCLNGLN